MSHGSEHGLVRHCLSQLLCLPPQLLRRRLLLAVLLQAHQGGEVAAALSEDAASLQTLLV